MLCFIYSKITTFWHVASLIKTLPIRKLIYSYKHWSVVDFSLEKSASSPATAHFCKRIINRESLLILCPVFQRRRFISRSRRRCQKDAEFLQNFRSRTGPIFLPAVCLNLSRCCVLKILNWTLRCCKTNPVYQFWNIAGGLAFFLLFLCGSRSFNYGLDTAKPKCFSSYTEKLHIAFWRHFMPVTNVVLTCY